MKMNKTATTLLVTILCSVLPTQLWAGEPDTSQHEPDTSQQTMLDRYREGALTLEMGFFSQSISRNGKELELGFLGGDHEKIFAGSPRALDAMEDYETMRIAGFTMWAAGLATLVAELVILLANPDTLMDPTGVLGQREPNTLFWVLLASGTGVGLVGGVVQQGANAHLSDAIKYFNEDLYQRLRSGGQGVSLRVSTAF